MGKKKITVFNIEGHKDFPSGFSTQVDWEPRTNIIVSDNEAIIELELPGVLRKDIHIEAEGESELVIKGMKNKPRTEYNDPSYFLFEREFGRFYKRLILDFQIDIGKISSNLKDGVLTVLMHKKKKSKVRISIEKEDHNG